jgi:hypothetical protein
MVYKPKIYSVQTQKVSRTNAKYSSIRIKTNTVLDNHQLLTAPIRIQRKSPHTMYNTKIHSVQTPKVSRTKRKSIRYKQEKYNVQIQHAGAYK